MTDFAWCVAPEPTVTCLTSPVRSTDTTSSLTISAPKRSAWLRICSISAGPMMPSAKPGKFSTSVVFISAPPAVTEPSNISGGQVGARGVDRGGEAGGTGSDDDDVADLAHRGAPSWLDRTDAVCGDESVCLNEV